MGQRRERAGMSGALESRVPRLSGRGLSGARPLGTRNPRGRRRRFHFFQDACKKLPSSFQKIQTACNFLQKIANSCSESGLIKGLQAGELKQLWWRRATGFRKLAIRISRWPSFGAQPSAPQASDRGRTTAGAGRQARTKGVLRCDIQNKNRTQLGNWQGIVDLSRRLARAAIPPWRSRKRRRPKLPRPLG